MSEAVDKPGAPPAIRLTVVSSSNVTTDKGKEPMISEEELTAKV